MVALPVIAAVVIEGVLPHLNLLVTGNRRMQDVTESLQVEPPERAQKLSPLLWQFL
jgi:hypothetical protein